MRPKLLEIEGLQSFRGSQKINFDSLSETGLFGIFGPTGSGKSTILDAITFVLYGKVKRAERGTKGIINTNHNTVRVSFTFELLKNNSRKTYRVERTYQRKKDSQGSCEPKIARLIEITEVGEIPVCDKATEVSNSIEELLGLNHDDFTRAVVLPQNSFQEFLMLDNAKKREMLERIFYLEEYGNNLNEKLSRKISMLKSRLDKVSGALLAYEDASAEALEEAHQAFEDAIVKKKQVEKDFKQLEAQYNEANEVWQLVQNLKLVNEREEQHLANKEDINDKRSKLEKALKADGLLDLINRVLELSKKLSETERQLDDIVNQLPAVEASLDESRNSFNRLKNESELEKPKLIEFRARLMDALDLSGELSNLDIALNRLLTETAELKGSIEDKKKTISEETGQVQAVEQKIQLLKCDIGSLKTDPEYRDRIQEGVKLENDVESIRSNLSELNKRAELLNKDISSHEERSAEIAKKVESTKQAAGILDIQRKEYEDLKPEDRNAVMKYQEELHKWLTIFDILQFKQAEVDSVRTKLLKMEALLTNNKGQLEGEERTKLKVVALYEECLSNRESAVRVMETYTAYTLAKDLKEGEPCPVCGSEHHPQPALLTEGTELALLKQQLENADKELKTAESVLRDAERKCLVTSEQIRNVDEQVRQFSKELIEKANDFSDTGSKLPEELRGLELNELSTKFKQMQKACEEKLQAINDWEQKLEDVRRSIEHNNKQLSALQIEENGVLTELNVNRVNRNQLENSINEATKSFEQMLEEYQLFLNNYQINSASEELIRLAENDRKVNQLQKEIEQAELLLIQKRIYLEQLKTELGELANKNTNVEAEARNINNKKGEKALKIKALVGTTNIEDELVRIDNKLTEYSVQEEQYLSALKHLENQHNELITQKTSLENQRSIYADNLSKEREILDDAIFAKGFADSEEVKKAILQKDEQQALSSEISEYDRIERVILAEKEMVEKKLSSRMIEEEEWNLISSSFKEKTICKEECASKVEVAKNSYNTLKSKHDKWLKLNEKYKELSHKHGLFDQINKLLRAERGKDNSFIDYIAEERLRYVAIKASDTLGMITKHKYALELDSDIGFIIRDNANGGVHRMVNSLSGGETFLTSLSLALALTEQIQLKGQSPLEFFFLDEGFGTLDNSLLDTVIESLERLSKKERVIGLISHVPELRNRIERRLIVEPPSYHGEGSRVRIEKA
ncbi:MAG: hypothetical protein KGZ45_11035 [Clostridium sp.]|nr:hypothetical protein [Clostridium sp.]